MLTEETIMFVINQTNHVSTCILSYLILIFLNPFGVAIMRHEFNSIHKYARTVLYRKKSCIKTCLSLKKNAI